MNRIYRERRLPVMTALDRKALGKRIKEARITLGLTQPRLAEKLGVSLKTIERHEAGARCPSLALVFELSRLIGRSLDEFCA